MMARLLPKDPDLETEDETYHTWHIQDWRKLRRKEHGPISIAPVIHGAFSSDIERFEGGIL